MKPIPDFPDYFADKQGNIYSMKPFRNYSPKPTEARKLKPTPDKDGYLHVGLQKNGRTYRRAVHRLILETFVGKRPKGMQCCHGVKGKLCNTPDNLEWGTQSENCKDKYRDGTVPDYKGEKHPQHKLNEIQVRIIRKAYSWRGKDGLNATELAQIFIVNPRTIQKIIHRKRWNHI